MRTKVLESKLRSATYSTTIKLHMRSFKSLMTMETSLRRYMLLHITGGL